MESTSEESKVVAAPAVEVNAAAPAAAKPEAAPEAAAEAGKEARAGGIAPAATSQRLTPRWEPCSSR